MHDYHTKHFSGVRKAVSEFLKDKPEKIIELPLNVFAGFYPADQAMIIKR